MILGMDIWVFTAWILTILAAVLCVLYGIYHEYLKKSGKEKPKSGNLLPIEARFGPP